MIPTFVFHGIFVATFLLSSGNSYGQYPGQNDLPSKDSILVKIIGSGTEVFPKSDAELFYKKYKSKQDTVKVLLLVCDTLRHRPFNDHSNPKITPYTPYRYPPVWWQFGYEVRSYSATQFLVCGYNETGFDGKQSYCLKERLDENKKPLPKSIVVWMTKEIK